MLPILDPTHLEVLLPISLSDNDEFMQSLIPDIPRTHNMQTRLQSGTIEKKDYSIYHSSVPELQSLKIEDRHVCYAGFA